MKSHLKHFIFSLLLLAFQADSEEWRCSSDFQSQCQSAGCEVRTGQDFTALSVTMTQEGYLEVCAYSGCWKGEGKVVSLAPFLVVIGENISWADPAGSEPVDILLSLELATSVAIVQAGPFHQPLLCTADE